MDDHVAEVDQHPLGFALAFHAERLHVELLGERDDFVGDGFDVARRGAGGDHHEVGDAAFAADVDLDDIACLELLDGFKHGLEQYVGGGGGLGRRVLMTWALDVKEETRSTSLSGRRHDYSGGCGHGPMTGSAVRTPYRWCSTM